MEVLNINAVVIKSKIILKSFLFDCNTTYEGNWVVGTTDILWGWIIPLIFGDSFSAFMSGKRICRPQSEVWSASTEMLYLRRYGVITAVWGDPDSVFGDLFSGRDEVLGDLYCTEASLLDSTSYSVPVDVNLCCPHPLLCTRVFFLWRDSSFVCCRGCLTFTFLVIFLLFSMSSVISLTLNNQVTLAKYNRVHGTI